MDSARARLQAALDAAEAARAAGDPDAAQAALDAAAADPALRALPPLTALGLNRRLHAGLLRQAKRTGDRVARVGLQAHLVPPAAVLAPFAAAAAAAEDRAARAAADAAAVPRVIHQVWAGPLPPPVTLHAWRAHAAAQGYGYRLWREADLAAAGIDRHPVWQARRAAGDWPGAVDAARYGILARHGGVYVDADWVPTRDDTGLHDWVALRGLVALAEDVPRLTGAGSLLLANSLLAAPPGHPVFRRLVDILPAVEAALPGAPAWWTTGPLVFTLLARTGAVTLAPHGLVAGTLPREATLADARALAPRGLIAAWKPW